MTRRHQPPKEDQGPSSSNSEHVDTSSSISDYYFDDCGNMLVIGIDFGTTYSGAAWATNADFQAGRVNLITRWPGTSREEGKAPTELFFEDGQELWGYDVPDDCDPVRWFKLLLLKDEDLGPELQASEYILRGRKMLQENERTAVDLVTDYLRGFWKHVLYEIKQARGSTVIDALRIHVVITLPAIWKGYARQSMHEAVEKAGILDDRDAGDTTLSFAPEPEAAALSTLCEPGRVVSKGDVYVMCDAGGGTVDLITYEILSSKPLTVREATEGTGGLCGGIFIDEAFERICKNRLGRKWGRLNKLGNKDLLKGEWEYAIKPQFRVSYSGKEYTVEIPAQVFQNTDSRTDLSRQPLIKNGRIHFRESDLQGAFTDVFANIEKLVDGQIGLARQRGKSITGIILVGGLGSSLYLCDTLRARYSRQRVAVLQSRGMGPRTAISRGAVYKGFLDNCDNMNEAKPPIMVTSTISRAHFGIVYMTKFQEGEHLEEDREWNIFKEEWAAGNQMSWFIQKGEDVSQTNPVRKLFYQDFRKGSGKVLKLAIYQCTDVAPPSRKTETVTHLCDIQWDVDVSFDDLEWITNKKGIRYKELWFEIEFIPQGATVEVAVYVGGLKQKGKDSAVNIRYTG